VLRFGQLFSAVAVMVTVGLLAPLTVFIEVVVDVIATQGIVQVVAQAELSKLAVSAVSLSGVVLPAWMVMQVLGGTLVD
jgi:hypothetical protein